MKDKILTVLAWIFVVFFAIIAFIIIFTQILAGLALIAVAVALVPIIKKPKLILYGTVIMGLILFFALWDNSVILKDFIKEEVTQEDFETFMTDMESVNEIGETGPFYMGNTPAIDERTIAFEDARQKKVEEIQELTETSTERLVALMYKVAEFRAKAWEYPYRLSAIYQNEELGEDVFTAIGAGMNYAGFTDIRMAHLESLNLELDDHEEDHYDREYEHMQFQKMLALVDATNSVQLELAHAHARLAIYHTAFENDEDPAVKKLIEEMDSEIQQRSEEISTELEIQNINLLYIQRGMAQLEMADYAYLQETAFDIKEKMPDMKTYVKAIENRNDISDEEKEMIRDMVDVYDQLADFYLEALEEVDTSDLEKLIAYVDTYELMPTAHAGFMDSLSYLGGKVKSGLKKSGEIMWTGTKIAAQSAAKGIQGIKQGVGLAVDMSAAHVKTIMDAGTSMYYGNSVSDFLSTVKGNYTEAWKKWKQGDSGSQVFKDTQEMLGALDESFGDITSAGIGMFTLGTDAFYLRTVAKGVGKITSGMFTGLGKGIAKLLDTKATLTEQVSGFFDIALTAFPLTKSFSKASDVAKGAKGYVSQIINKVAKVFKIAKYNKKIAQVTVKEAKGLFDSATKKSIIRHLNKIYNGEMGELVKKGKQIVYSQKGIVNTIKNNIDDSYQGLKSFFTETYESSLSGVGKAIVKTAGETGEDYIDNVVSNKLDEIIVNSVLEKYKDKINSFYDYLMGAKGEKVSDVESTNNPEATGKKPEAPPAPTYTPPAPKPVVTPTYTPPAASEPVSEPVYDDYDDYYEEPYYDDYYYEDYYDDEEYEEPAPEPEPEPVSQFPDGVPGGTVKACESCWQVGLDCVCGETKCICCSPNATDCSPNN